MAVAGGQVTPVARKIWRSGYACIRTCLVVCFRLTPDADVRVVFSHERHEIVVIIALVSPHAVLDIPVEKADLVLLIPSLRYFFHRNLVKIESVGPFVGGDSLPVKRSEVGAVIDKNPYLPPGACAKQAWGKTERIGHSPLGDRIARSLDAVDIPLYYRAFSALD